MNGAKSNIRDIFFVLAASWIARAVFIAILPANARSFDAFAWESVSLLLQKGINPYHATEFISWPPFWMQIIFCISKASTFLHIPFFRALQIFLISVESFVIVQLYKLTREVAPAANARNIVLFGISLNPIAILLVCQHCNFDVLVALWILLFVRHLIKYQRTAESSHWLAACVFLGLGILTKTVPLILFPLLASGFRQVPALLKAIGAFVFLGPVTLGMSIIYVLAPGDITSKVLGYRAVASSPEYYGVPNLFHLAGADRFSFIHHILFYGLVAVALITLWRFSWRRFFGENEIILVSALVMASIPALGPGWGTQYIYWLMPLLVATWPLFSTFWRRTLVGFGIVAATTYVVEYSFIPALGSYLTFILDPTFRPGGDPQMLSPSMLAVFHAADSATGLTILNLPIFIAYLALLVSGFTIIFKTIPRPLNFGILKPIYLAVAASCLVSIGFTFARNQPAKTNPASLDSPVDSDKRREEAISLNNMAWELATSPDAHARDGALAVELAHSACDLADWRLPEIIGTLAAADAEAGRFQEAIANAQRAHDLAIQLNNSKVAESNSRLLLLYQSGQPFHQETNSPP